VRDGETQVLGGLINSNERVTLSKLPGLGDIPGLGRLFGSNGLQSDKSELVLLITPHIVRNLRPGVLETAAYPSGTEAAAGTRPATIRSTAPRSLSMSSGGARSTPAAGGTPPPSAEGAPLAGSPAPEGPLSVSLAAPPQVALGSDFSITVRIADAGTASAGEAVLSYNPSQLLVSGGEGGRVVVPLSGSGGVLSGSATARVLSTGIGSTDVAVIQGRAELAEGQTRALGGASTSIRLGR
jgi:general secretion pathway protein D